jgi:hypothetical protein
VSKIRRLSFGVTAGSYRNRGISRVSERVHSVFAFTSHCTVCVCYWITV